MPSQAASLQPVARALIAAQVVAASAASAVFELPNDLTEMTLMLEATAQAGTSPTIDAVLQITPDGGTKWFSSGNKFTQLTASGQMRVISMSRQRHAGQAAAEYDGTQVTGAASSANGPLSRKARLFFTLGGSASPSMTLNLWLIANPPATV